MADKDSPQRPGRSAGTGAEGADRGLEQELEALRRSEAEHRLLIEAQSDLVVKIDPAGRLLFVNPSYCAMFGKPAEALLGQVFLPLVHEDDRAGTEAAMAALHHPPHRCYLEQRAWTVHGWRWLGWSDSAVLDEQGGVTAIVGVGRDIHQRKLDEQALTEVQRRLELALDSSGIGFYSADFLSGAVDADERYLAMLGYRPGEVEVTFDWWRRNVHADDLASFAEQSERVLRGELSDFSAEYRMRHRDGGWVWVQDHARIYEHGEDGRALACTGLHIDVSRRKEAELELAHHAEHDTLTRLLNRRGLWRAITQTHAQGRRNGRAHSVAIVDLDFFKQINDSYGHAVGDEVLRQFARLLEENARDSDWLGRWGGEEFLLLMPDTDHVQSLHVLERLRSRIAEAKFRAGGQSVQLTASIGVAAFALDEREPDHAVSRADTALYQAKRLGRNRVCSADSTTAAGERAVATAFVVEHAIRAAKIRPAVQPVVRLSDREPVAEETLARVIAADGTPLRAASFIDVARQLRLMHRIDQALFCQLVERLRGGSPRPLQAQFLHCSGDLLRRGKRLAQLAADAMEAADRSLPKRIVLTLDEAQVTSETAQVAEALAPLLAYGCRLAVAGFGGEASTLRFVTHLPVRYLMLAPELTRRAGGSRRARAVLVAIQRAAAELGITTIAKQIEDEDSARRLAELGVDWGTGYLFGAPVGPDAAPEPAAGRGSSAPRPA